MAQALRSFRNATILDASQPQPKKSALKHFILIAVASLAMTYCGRADAISITVGSYEYDGSGLPADDLGSAMLNPANFSKFGYTNVVDGGEVDFGSLTSSYLNSLDLFFTDRRGIDRGAPPGDIALLESWVNNGGVLFIHNDRSTSFTDLDPLLNTFGVDIVEASTSSVVPLTIDVPTHPIMDGPFGTVGAMGLCDASRFAATSPDVEVVASWPNSDAAILVAGPTVGRLGTVVVLPDVERFLREFDRSSLGSGDTEIAALNAVAFGVAAAQGGPAVPEASAYAMAAIAFVGLGLYGWRRKRA